MSFEGVSLKCKNFKCFADQPQGFEVVRPINVIIGRNNSGKTTLLDLVEYATHSASGELGRGHRGIPPAALLYRRITEKLITDKVDGRPRRVTYEDTQWSRVNARRWALKNLSERNLVCEIIPESGVPMVVSVDEFTPEQPVDYAVLQAVLRDLNQGLKNPFEDYQFKRIAADRDVSLEPSDNNLKIDPNGDGITNAIYRFQIDDALNPDIVNHDILTALNDILRPDANYTGIQARQRGNEFFQIWIDEPGKGRIPLSDTGSGFKTVLQVLVNLHLTPRIEKNLELSRLIFGFEELENNLHPAIQRRLFNHLRQIAINEGCHFFITTHSSVVIDLFSDDEQAQLLHVTHDGESAKVASVQTQSHGHNVLDDLDVRASDLLQTNVVVWLEGPSDRIYFNRWIELASSCELVEGVHYQCLPIGGAAGAHVSFDWTEELVNDMIEALKFNRHAILLVDSDRRKAEDDLKEYAQRMTTEVEKVGGYAWITDGKEVENYIPTDALRQYLSNDSLRGPGQYADALAYIANKKGDANRPRKVDLARAITPLLEIESLKHSLDLISRLHDVCDRIRAWNRV